MAVHHTPGRDGAISIHVEGHAGKNLLETTLQVYRPKRPTSAMGPTFASHVTPINPAWRDTPTPTKMHREPDVPPSPSGGSNAPLYRKEKWTSPEDIAKHYARVQEEPSTPTRRALRARVQEPADRWKLTVAFGQTIRTKLTEDSSTPGGEKESIVTGRFPYNPRGSMPPMALQAGAGSKSAEKPPRTPQSGKKKTPQSLVGRLTPLQKVASSKFKGELETNLEKAKVFV